MNVSSLLDKGGEENQILKLAPDFLFLIAIIAELSNSSACNIVTNIQVLNTTLKNYRTILAE